MFQSLIVSPNRMRLQELLHRLVPIAFCVLLLASPLCRSAWADDLTIGVGEIRLDGTILSVDVEQKTFVLTATSFTLPSGKTAQLAAAKSKSVAVNEQAILQTQEQTPKRIGLADLKAGMTASVIGRDAGTGHALPARIVAVMLPATVPSAPAASAPAPVAAPAQAEPTLKIQSGKITGLRFSPDGTTLIATTPDGTLKLWNVHTGELLHSFAGHHAVGSPAVSPDGTLIASTSLVPDPKLAYGGQSSVSVLNAQTGEVVYSIPISPVIWDLSFSPDGRILAGLSETTKARPPSVDAKARSTSFQRVSTVMLWDAPTGKLLHTLNTENAELRDVHMNTLTFSPDDKMLAAGGFWMEKRDNRTVSMADVCWWDVQTGAVSQKFLDHNFTSMVSFTPDSATLIAGVGGGLVNFWTTSTGELQHSLNLGKDAQAYPATFSPDGTLIAGPSYTIDKGVGAHNSLILWDTKTGHVKSTIQTPSVGLDTPVFSPDSKMVASFTVAAQGDTATQGDTAATVYLWKIEP